MLSRCRNGKGFSKGTKSESLKELKVSSGYTLHRVCLRYTPNEEYLNDGCCVATIHLYYLCLLIIQLCLWHSISSGHLTHYCAECSKVARASFVCLKTYFKGHSRHNAVSSKAAHFELYPFCLSV